MNTADYTRRLRGIRAIAVLLILLVANPAVACRCAQRTLADYYAQADTVMQVRIRSVRRVESQDLGDHLVAEFEAIRRFKTDGSNPTALKTPASSASCGLSQLHSGDRLWVFAYRNPLDDRTAVWMNTCSGSRDTTTGFLHTVADQVPTALERLGQPVQNHDTRGQYDDSSQLALIGFSADGRYLAYEQFGVFDGGPTAWCEIHFIDVPGNKPALAAVKRQAQDDTMDLPGIRQRTRQASTPRLTQLGIVAGNSGAHLLHHPATDLGVASHTASFAQTAPLHGRPAPTTHTLTLNELPGTAQGGCGEGVLARQFSLEITTPGNPVPLVLQTTQSPRCALGFRIRDVYLYHDKHMAIFLGVRIPGFEGEDLRFTVVTSRLAKTARQQ